MILIVDDSDDLRLLLGRILESEGISTTSAAGGPEAIELVRASMPDCVILDVQMPQMDGWETLARLRELSERLPVIMCTVKSREADHERGWRLGCDGYITKPFDLVELVSQVKAVMGRSYGERLAERATHLARIAMDHDVTIR